MRLRTESIADDPNLVAVLNGPLVLAADLGPAGSNVVHSGAANSGAENSDAAHSDVSDLSDPPEDVAAALVGPKLTSAIQSVAGLPATFKTFDATRPENLTLKPFFSQYDRRSAVYLRKLTVEQWEDDRAVYLAEQARVKDVRARSIDVVYLGESQRERDHALREQGSETLLYRGRSARLARGGAWFEFRMKVTEGPLMLQTTYWGDERNRAFRILVDGVPIASQRLNGERSMVFFDQDYLIPVELTRGKASVIVRFEPEEGFSAGPVYECRMLPLRDKTLPREPVAT
jgi:hypothetical protein